MSLQTIPLSIKVKLKDLVPYANNSRTHSDLQVTQIRASIREFGFTNPVLVDDKLMIIAGHGRVLAASLEGMTEVPAIKLSHLSKQQIKAYVIADNKLALNAGWDEELLAVELKALDEDGFNISMIGFTDKELKELMPKDIMEDSDKDDHVPDTADNQFGVNVGDVWQLGDHRLMCGDSTDLETVKRLLEDHQPDMVYTDPPYGINEKGDRTARKTGLAQNHNFKDFKDDSIDYAIKAYEICDVLKIPRQVWWGANYYCHFLPQSNNWFVWDKRVEEKMHDTQSDCEMAWVKSKWSSVRIFRHLWKGFNKDSERNSPRIHPTQKPIALAEWSFDYFRDVKSVLDLFMGSGSTLIACEKSQRKCYGMEIDPHYCSVIINRWQEFTGDTARLL